LKNFRKYIFFIKKIHRIGLVENQTKSNKISLFVLWFLFFPAIKKFRPGVCPEAISRQAMQVKYKKQCGCLMLFYLA